jgi:phage terminase large subunit-like protein
VSVAEDIAGEWELLDDEIGPQPGAQLEIARCPADMAVYGGHAFSGKSYMLLMEAFQSSDGMRSDVENPQFAATIFRRTCPMITNEGGLWDTAMELYGPLGVRMTKTNLQAQFPSGARVRFGHLDTEQDLINWQGAQIDYVGFDQLEQFTERQFFYLTSRTRSMSGAYRRIRGTCNPDPDSFLRTFLSWWIDDDTGLAIEERSGVIRYMARVKDTIEWADTEEELIQRLGPDTEPLSVTYIIGRITDNQLGLQANPKYLAFLKNLPYVDRRRLLEGDWNARVTAGMIFKEEWFEIVDNYPSFVDAARCWDRAATPADAPGAGTASYTAGGKIARGTNGLFYITDMQRFQKSGGAVQEFIETQAKADGMLTRVGGFQDPGGAGKAEIDDFLEDLAGFETSVLPTARPRTGKDDDFVDSGNPKVNYAKPWSRMAEKGKIKLVRGPWNKAFTREAEDFDGKGRCDQIDSISGGYYMLTQEVIAGVI